MIYISTIVCIKIENVAKMSMTLQTFTQMPFFEQFVMQKMWNFELRCEFNKYILGPNALWKYLVLQLFCQAQNISYMLDQIFSKFNSDRPVDNGQTGP